MTLESYAELAVLSRVKGLLARASALNNFNNNSNFNANNRNVDNNNRRLRGIVRHTETTLLMTYRDLWKELCSYDNLFLAYKKARKHKTLKHYVIEFEKNLEDNLLTLQVELQLKSYSPKPLETFIIRDPKTRKISKSDFRDRIIHHALCNIIEPIFDKIFIYDSYANRLNKGTLKAIDRFEIFMRKVSQNNTITCYALKADIKHYFESVNHKLLLEIISKRIKDKNVLWLIKIILDNHKTDLKGRGMPLGNLTSQFFANVYLNELDYFIKNELLMKYYIRYVDDFVIFSKSRNELKMFEEKINIFLKEKLDIILHPEKTKILVLDKGIGFLGLRIYYFYKLLKKSNLRKFKNKLSRLIFNYDNKKTDYDTIYDFLEGWIAYSKNANTYKLRKHILNHLEQKFSGEISTKELNRYLKEQ